MTRTRPGNWTCGSSRSLSFHFTLFFSFLFFSFASYNTCRIYIYIPALRYLYYRKMSNTSPFESLVNIIFKPVGNAPILRKNKYEFKLDIERNHPFKILEAFLLDLLYPFKIDQPKEKLVRHSLLHSLYLQLLWFSFYMFIALLHLVRMMSCSIWSR